VVLRHDIDKLPANSLKMAHLEHDLGVAGSYYFRVVPGVWDAGVMKNITALGHVILPIPAENGIMRQPVFGIG